MNAVPELTTLWSTRYPTERSEPPEWMSYHFLREAEKCPLSASLKHARYRTLWERQGYPNRPNLGAFIGIIVHAATGFIVKSMIASQVTSMTDPRAMATLRSLGGYSRVIADFIKSLVNEESTNPRFAQVGPAIERALKQHVPQMREMLQQILAIHSWHSASESVKSNSKDGAYPRPQGFRFPLSVGTHFEVTLKHKQMMWTGRLDVVAVADEGCTISDLKTSSPASDHQEQMRVYAMLWDGDDELNPRRTPVATLELIYGSGHVLVRVPVALELDQLKRDLTTRTDLVKNDLSLAIVPAKPTRENCQYCQVKLLCDHYWSNLAVLGNAGRGLSNVVVIADEARDDHTWFARVSSSEEQLGSRRIVLRKFDGGSLFWSDIKPGTTIRLTDVLLSIRDPEDLPLISLTMLSEALFI